MATGTIKQTYEQGTFTPTVGSSTTQPGTTTLSNGRYWKCGNYIWLAVDWKVSANATSGSYIAIGNLPVYFTNQCAGATVNNNQGAMTLSRASYSSLLAFTTNATANNQGTAWVCGVFA